EMDEPERVQTEAEAIDLEPLETDELDREQPEAGPVDFEPFEMDEPDRSESIVPDEDENSRA
ncbi:MAG: hypothetical protein GXY36_13575, partial [Chloroflexi bacterium]|nr:hypothetical protein [Chloroflexota bacterium]